jgi:hypothetical protein
VRLAGRRGQRSGGGDWCDQCGDETRGNHVGRCGRGKVNGKAQTNDVGVELYRHNRRSGLRKRCGSRGGTVVVGAVGKIRLGGGERGYTWQEMIGRK